jgi:hypothetical protein
LVLPWICSRYDNGAEIEDPPFKDFIISDFSLCRAMKHSCGKIIIEIKATASYRDYRHAPVKLIFHVLNQKSAAWQEIFRGALRGEPTNDEVIRDYQDILKKASFTAVCKKDDSRVIFAQLEIYNCLQCDNRRETNNFSNV